MRKTSTFFISIAVVLLTFAPLTALAQNFTAIPFGGKVTTVLPCISPLGPSLHVTISSARIGAFGAPEMYIWTPATITKLVGPPLPKGQALGTADIPYFCWNVISGGFFGLFSAFSYLYGLRMQTVGTSFPLGGGNVVSADIPLF